MSSLYNNRKQEELFYLQEPQEVTANECNFLKGYFSNFKCEKSRVLAQDTEEFNCIGWAMGVKNFIEPKEINKYYEAKEIYRMVGSKYTLKTFPLHNYEKNAAACMQAIDAVFEEYHDDSVLPQKNDYVAIDTLSSPLQDDTIAFYFKDGQEASRNNRDAKGFQHAARYVKDVNGWVSEVWISKLGGYKLITHGEHELEGEYYGDILCYLIPNYGANGGHDDL